jgi:hypothetical protein
MVSCRLGHRLANFRLGFVSAERGATITITLDGNPVRVRVGSVSIHDILNDAPDTCSLTIDGATAPTIDQVLQISINLDAPTLLFSGVLQSVGASYEGRPGQRFHPCTAIDETPRANRYVPFGSWTNVSATTIAQYLIATFAPGFTTVNVQQNLPPISVNFDGTEGMNGALTQIAKLIGGYFYYEQFDLHLFTAETTNIPAPIDATHRFLDDPPIAQTLDTSQVRTRNYGKGYGDTTLSAVAAGESIIPIANAVMFNPAGGKAITDTQRIAYTGTAPGGGGSLIGPGVTPGSAPNLALVVGAGVDAGTHQYAATYVTAGGESLPSPVSSLVVGQLPPPATAPTVVLSPGGVGPDAGLHAYEVSFVGPGGETTPGPLVAFTQPTIAAGTTPITTPVDQWDGNGYGDNYMKAGDHIALYYTYSSSPTDHMPPYPVNESPVSPASGGYILKQTLNTFSPPGYIMNFAFQVPYSHDPNVKWFHVWISVNYQQQHMLWITSAGNPGFPNDSRPGSTWANLNYGQYSQGLLADLIPTTFNPIVGGAILSAIPVGIAGVTARKLWRAKANDWTYFQFLTTLADNTTTTYTDRIADASLGANAPTVGTLSASQVQISAIPIGPSLVTARRIYRSAASVLTPLRLLATLADNTTTTFLDTLADATLGANAPTGDTSGLQQPVGVVNAGSSTMVVAGLAWARAGGGWAVIGNGAQVIRYTGFTGNTLTGIPMSGPGAILATVAYGASVTGAPLLTGVTGLVLALINGAPVNIWVQRDDLNAQAAIHARDGTDGIIEHLISDERRAEASLMALCDADLVRFSTPLKTVVYGTRDIRTKSGKPITFALTSPAISDTLTIQDVTITELGIAPRLLPKFVATASNVRFSLEDLLRRMANDLGGT